jgi:hypothetical protein
LIKIAHGGRSERIDGILSLALNDSDWRFVQRELLDLLEDEDRDIVLTAILGFGHLGRIHGELDVDVVVPRLTALREDSALQPRIDNAIEDIQIFVKGRTNRQSGGEPLAE